MENQDMKKMSVLALLLVAAFGLCAAAPSRFTAGTYTGSSSGMGGDVTVEVVLSADRIISVKVLSQKETVSISGPAIERIPASIVAQQSLAVDVISGATTSSEAIIDAVADAIKKAGGDIALLKTVSVSKKASKPPRAVKMKADVVVIGAGASGIAAAIEARDNGAKKVILLEKMASIGGTTCTSQGVIAGYETKIAKELGVSVSYDAMYNNLMSNASYRLDPVLTKITVERSGQTIDWLQERLAFPFLKKITVSYGPLQMMHAIDGGGAGMYQPFLKAIADSNIELVLETRATSLITDSKGAIKGVKAERNGGAVTISCKSVVVATGGYAYNPLLTTLLNPEMSGIMGIGFPGATGDGLIMGSAVGAALTHTNNLMAVLKDYEIMTKYAGTSNTANVSRFIAAPNLVLVGKNAKRFVDEKNVGYMTQALNEPIFDQMHKDELGYVWAISDAQTLNSMGVKRGLGMEFISADSAQELATRMGLDPATLAATIDSYNGYAKTGIDPDFKRTKPVALTPPYCAVSVMPCEIITYGGLARNVKGEVIRADGSAIPGLYVAGEAGANSSFMGFTLSNAFTWGRIAGASAANFANKK